MSIIKAVIEQNVPLKTDVKPDKNGSVLVDAALKDAYDAWANGFEQHIKDAVKDRVKAVVDKELQGKPLTKAIRAQVINTIKTVVEKM